MVLFGLLGKASPQQNRRELFRGTINAMSKLVEFSQRNLVSIVTRGALACKKRTGRKSFLKASFKDRQSLQLIFISVIVEASWFSPNRHNGVHLSSDSAPPYLAIIHIAGILRRVLANEAAIHAIHGYFPVYRWPCVCGLRSTWHWRKTRPLALVLVLSPVDEDGRWSSQRSEYVTVNYCIWWMRACLPQPETDWNGSDCPCADHKESALSGRTVDKASHTQPLPFAQFRFVYGTGIRRGYRAGMCAVFVRVSLYVYIQRERKKAMALNCSQLRAFACVFFVFVISVISLRFTNLRIMIIIFI